jgi:hypothetical protein
MEPTEVIEKVNEILDKHHLNRLTDAKVRTHGGQWNGPCPRCKILTGNGGKDRLRVHPARPIEGHGSREDPIFCCRICKRTDDPTADWSGDLVQFVRDTMNLSFRDARAWLGLEPSNGMEIKPKTLEPTSSESGAPCLEWQQQGFSFIITMMEELWHHPKALESVMKGRGLPDDVIHEANLGWQDDPDLYVDGEPWGEEGRIRIPRGIVIPELHYGLNGEKELWSIAIRRTKQDIMEEEFGYTDEEVMRGKKAQRYWLIRGSVKSLYGAESIKKGQLCVLVEGQFDALSIRAGGRSEFGFAAIQGAASGKADPRILGFWLSRAKGVLLALDPDKAGEQAYEFWSTALADSSIDHRPRKGDLNDLLKEKGPDGVYAFLDRGRRKYFAIHPESAVKSPQDDRQDSSVSEDVSLGISQNTEPLTALSDAILSVQAEIEIEEIAKRIMGSFEMTPPLVGEVSLAPMPEGVAGYVDIMPGLLQQIGQHCKECKEDAVLYTEEGWGYCQSHRPDKTENMCCYNACPGVAIHRNVQGYGWCRSHFASFQLLDNGERLRYAPMAVDGGRGLIKPEPLDSGEGHWQEVGPCTIMGGEQRYYAFARSADPAMIWRAAYEAHACLNVKRRRSPAKAPCCRLGCKEDAAKPIQLFWDTVDGKWNSALKYSASKGYTVHSEGNEALHFCPLCTDAAYLLEIAEMRGYEEWKTSLVHVKKGEDAWIEFVTQAEFFSVVCVFDDIRREFPAVWKEVLEIIHAAM